MTYLPDSVTHVMEMAVCVSYKSNRLAVHVMYTVAKVQGTCDCKQSHLSSPDEVFDATYDSYCDKCGYCFELSLHLVDKYTMPLQQAANVQHIWWMRPKNHDDEDDDVHGDDGVDDEVAYAYEIVSMVTCLSDQNFHAHASTYYPVLFLLLPVFHQ